MIKYKYISKPYTLDELLAGNSIFRIYCSLFNNLYEWEISQEEDFEVFDYVNVNHLESVFNEFLNILSLFIYDKDTYNNTINLLKEKAENFEMFEELIYIIPQMLYHLEIGYDFKVLERIMSLKIKEVKANTEVENDDKLLEIFSNHIKRIKIYFANEEFHDLVNFFDKPKIEDLNIMIGKIPFKHFKPTNFNANNHENLDLIKLSDIHIYEPLIFKEDGQQVFNMIVERTPYILNSAFFSYLYFFLKDDLKKLRLTGRRDSKVYRDYIIDQFKIPFKTLQLNNSNNQYKKEEMTIFFTKVVSENFKND